MEKANSLFCRCCLEPDKNNTFQSLSSRLLDMFMACTTFEISYDVGPWWICSTCVIQLSHCYDFHERCKTSNKSLLNKLASNDDSKKEVTTTQCNDICYDSKMKHELSHTNKGISSVKYIYQNLVNALEKINFHCSSCRKILKKILAVRKHFERHKCHCERFSGSKVRYDSEAKDGISIYQSEDYSLRIVPDDNNKSEVIYSTDGQVVKAELNVNTDTLHNTATDEHLESLKIEVDNAIDFQYECKAASGYDKDEDDVTKVRQLKQEYGASDEPAASPCELQLEPESQPAAYYNTDVESDDDRPLKVNNKESFNCNNCNKHFEDITQFQEHMHTHQWPMERKCDLCGKEFKTLRGLRLHKIIHADVRKFVCDVCGKGFVFDYKLKQHSRTHIKEKLYACEHCGKMYKTMRILKIHYLTHASEKLFSCQNCAKMFRTEHNLKAHVKRCGGNKDYICNECGKAFVNKTELLIHMRAHTKEKPYPCAHCDKCFKTQSHRSVHVRSHTGERPHECAECGKCFMINRTLKIHMRIHSGELPYPCHVCSRRFRQPNVLKAHMKVHKILTFDNP